MVTSDSDIQRQAERFLETGKVPGGVDLDALAAVCDQLVRQQTEHSSPRAIAMGKRFLKLASGYEGTFRLTALRALGWALLVGGQYAEAREIYLKARRASQGDALARARIDRVLVDVYMYLGKSGEAVRRARQAMAAFKKLGAEADLAKTRVNYANVLHRQDRHREARDLYREAGDYFRNQNNDLAAAVCEYNEANTLVQLFEFDGAEELYTSARQSFAKHGHDLRATSCLYGLAWLHMLQARFHVALQELITCEENYRESGQERESILCQLDRAETYLSLNLLIDARESAADAEARSRKLGIKYEEAKGAFFKAKALAGLDKKHQARQALDTALKGFQIERNESFAAAVKFAHARLTGNAASVRKAFEKARRRLPAGQLPLWEALCDLELLVEDCASKPIRDRLKTNPAVNTVPHLRAQYQTILGDCEAARGQLDNAVTAWSNAAQLLNAVRASLPPIDIRSAFSRGYFDPYVSLIDVMADDKPDRAAVWHEWYKTSGVWAVSGKSLAPSAERTRAQESLADLAAHISAYSSHMIDSPGERDAAVEPSLAAYHRIGDAVRAGLAAVQDKDDKSLSGEADLTSRIKQLSQRNSVIQLHLSREDILAFIHEGGDTHGHRFVDGVRHLNRLVSQWRFFVEGAPYAGESDQRRLAEDQAALLERIGNWLWAPLEMTRTGKSLLLIVDGKLASLPWAAVRYDGDHLADRHDIVMAPSIRHHLFARSVRTRSREARVFVGDRSLLRISGDEFAPLVEDTRRRVKVISPCRRTDWPDRGAADVWHFSGHARFRTENPFYSSLELEDGPLFAADFRLKQSTVNLVTLAACRTAQQSLLPGEESTGLVRSLLEMGARNIIASNWAVMDQPTAEWMNSFYRHYVKGESLSGAVRHAMNTLREKYPSPYYWAAFQIFGAGS